MFFKQIKLALTPLETIVQSEKRKMFLAVPTFWFIQLIRFYQKYISLRLTPSCRFQPTCSYYLLEAIVRYGMLRGSFKGFFRILRCNPLCSGGYDPV